jgi:hypothetical protein
MSLIILITIMDLAAAVVSFFLSRKLIKLAGVSTDPKFNPITKAMGYFFFVSGVVALLAWLGSMIYLLPTIGS